MVTHMEPTTNLRGRKCRRKKDSLLQTNFFIVLLAFVLVVDNLPYYEKKIQRILISLRYMPRKSFKSEIGRLAW